MEISFDTFYLLVGNLIKTQFNLITLILSQECFFSGTTHPYPDDTFYSVGRVPRKLLMKYLGIKMYLVRLKQPPPKVADRKTCADIATLMLSSAGVCSPEHIRQA